MDKIQKATELQNKAKEFLLQYKLMLGKVEIIPKEIEVYYYKEGEFEDSAVHQKPQQTKKYKNHFYIHRYKSSDFYKSGRHVCVDFVVCDEENAFYSYLIRSAVINGEPIYGPNNTLRKIKEVGKYDNEALEEQEIKVVPCQNNYDDIAYTKRFGLGNSVEEWFKNCKLRFVVLDDCFKGGKYKDKKIIILDYIEQKKCAKEEMKEICEKYFYRLDEINEY